MLSILNFLIILFAGVVLAVLCVCFGGWLVFKSKTAGAGTPFIGRPPKGEVFTVPTDGAEDWPGEEAGMLDKAEELLSKLSGVEKK